jgi:hypothetical protein
MPIKAQSLESLGLVAGQCDECMTDVQVSADVEHFCTLLCENCFEGKAAIKLVADVLEEHLCGYTKHYNEDADIITLTNKENGEIINLSFT